MKRKIVVTLLIIVFIPILLICSYTIYFYGNCYFKTMYPKGYSSEKFEMIKIGMESNVINTLGAPFTKYTYQSDDSVFIYAQPKPSGQGYPYNRRVITVRKHRVIEILNYCGCYN